jgi:hypothetical protein
MGVDTVAQAFHNDGSINLSEEATLKTQSCFENIQDICPAWYLRDDVEATRLFNLLEFSRLCDHPVVHYVTPIQIKDTLQFIRSGDLDKHDVYLKSGQFKDVTKEPNAKLINYFEMLVNHNLGLYIC